MLKRRHFVYLLVIILLLFIIMWLHVGIKYTNTVESMKPVSLTYNDTPIDTVNKFNADYIDRFTTPKRSTYYGKLPNDTNNIEIIIPSKATITVYPNDTDSVLIKYAPHHGISRNYKLSGYGNFNRHLEILYEMTGNEIFNETIDLPEAE